MQALEFRHELGRYLVSSVVYRMMPGRWTVKLAPLYLTRKDPPVASHPGWHRVRIRLSGICGSDLGMVTGQDSLALEPEATYPFVPGHEILGELEDPARDASRQLELEPGSRVVVCPILGCEARGIDPCLSCASGWTGLCTRRDLGWPGPGAMIGYNRDTGGGWSEHCLVHTSQLWSVPDSVSDADAVLIDPAAASLAGLLRTNHPRPERTLVIGGGAVGILSAELDRVLDLSDHRELLVRHESQRLLAEARSVPAAVVRSERDFETWTRGRNIPSTAVTGYGRVYRGVFDRVIVAAGTRSALNWGLRTVAPRGTLVLVASPARLSMDPTLLWYREITVRGIYEFGPVPWKGRMEHPYAVLFELLREKRISLGSLVTHRFGLGDFVEAIDTAVRRSGKAVVKVVFAPQGNGTGGDGRDRDG